MPSDDVLFNTEMDGEMPVGMEEPEMNVEKMGNTDDNMNMEPDMSMNMENNKTMEILNQLSDKDKEAVEAYAESLLSKDEDKTEENTEDAPIPDGLNMEGPVNESFIFTKKQLSKLMENFGPTNDELEKKDNKVSKIKKHTIKNSPFNSPKFE